MKKGERNMGYARSDLDGEKLRKALRENLRRSKSELAAVLGNGYGQIEQIIRHSNEKMRIQADMLLEKS